MHHNEHIRKCQCTLPDFHLQLSLTYTKGKQPNMINSNSPILYFSHHMLIFSPLFHQGTIEGSKIAKHNVFPNKQIFWFTTEKLIYTGSLDSWYRQPTTLNVKITGTFIFNTKTSIWVTVPRRGKGLIIHSLLKKNYTIQPVGNAVAIFKA